MMYNAFVCFCSNSLIIGALYDDFMHVFGFRV